VVPVLQEIPETQSSLVTQGTVQRLVVLLRRRHRPSSTPGWPHSLSVVPGVVPSVQLRISNWFKAVQLVSRRLQTLVITPLVEVAIWLST